MLSALEGLTLAAPSLGPYVVPTAVAILIAPFAIQSRGTARIGRAFGPVMAAWFATIALLGIWGITKHPAILFGLDPRYAILAVTLELPRLVAETPASKRVEVVIIRGGEERSINVTLGPEISQGNP